MIDNHELWSSDDDDGFIVWLPTDIDDDYPPAIITPAFRRHFASTARWSVTASKKQIMLMYLTARTRGASIGERVALTAIYDASVHPPRCRSRSEWANECEKWQRRQGNRVDSIYPPWPYPPHDTRRLADVYRDVCRWLTSRDTRAAMGGAK